MVQKFTREAIAQVADIHTVPPVPGRTVPVDRSFEMPVRLYAAFAALCFGFVAVTGIGFATPEMILPLAVFTVFIAAFFLVPALWTRMAPGTAVAPRGWAEFRRTGIRTYTGHNTAAAASIQMLLLPVLLFAWGVATVTIAALVR